MQDRNRICRRLLTRRKYPTYNDAPRKVGQLLEPGRAQYEPSNMSQIDVFSALANPVRRELLVRLRQGPRAVNDLAQGFEIGRPAVSEHLQVLRKARLIREEPRGR